MREKRLDVLFVVPGNLEQVYQALAKKHATEPPAKARFVAAYLMRRGCGVDLIDANVEGFMPELMAKKVKEFDPYLVVMPVYGFNPSSSTQTMPAARSFAQAIKNLCPTTPIIMMGTHSAGLPQKTLEDEPIDYVCGGEGPITVHELLTLLKKGGGSSDLKKVRSLWYKVGSKVVHNAPAPLIDLNVEPALPGWKLMDPRRYYAHDWHTFWRDFEDRTPYANPYSREGCPFSCGFCNIQTPYREGETLQTNPNINSFRTLRPELFVEEIEYLVNNYGIKYIKIPDEMFGLGDHPVQVAKLMKERFGDSINSWAYFRVDTMNPKHAELYRSAGFRWTPFGIEAANSKVRSGQDKKFSDDYIRKIMDRVQAAGISIAMNFIFGLPGDTAESMQETYDLAVELNGAFANFYCNQALPISTQYLEAKKADYPLPERAGGPGWIGHSQYSYECEPFYMGSSLAPTQILAFRDKAHIDYYSRPEYRAMMLNDPNFGEIAMRNINEWVGQIRSLRRKILGHTKN